VDPYTHPGVVALRLLVANVDLAGRILADQDDIETWGPAEACRKLSDFRGYIRTYRPGQLLSVESAGGHGEAP
jgi:hypothetical protein